MDNHDKYKRLLNKKIYGAQWVEKYGKDKDYVDYQNLVINPLNEMKSQFNDEDRKAWGIVEKTLELFNGKIVG